MKDRFGTWKWLSTISVDDIFVWTLSEYISLQDLPNVNDASWGCKVSSHFRKALLAEGVTFCIISSWTHTKLGQNENKTLHVRVLGEDFATDGCKMANYNVNSLNELCLNCGKPLVGFFHFRYHSDSKTQQSETKLILCNISIFDSSSFCFRLPSRLYSK